jgi:Cdc6-like AAA superfamily ATPase
MAAMIPENFDRSTASSAEKKVFELLKSSPMTEGWIVFHSLGLTQRGKKPYGEIDFVVMIPGLGIACLEVKGGRIACASGKWETTNRYGKTESLNRSPFLQAREGMFSLIDSIKKKMRPELPFGIVFGYAVVMPDIDFDLVSPEWDRWQVIDNASLEKGIAANLIGLMKEQRKLSPTGTNYEPTVDSLKNLKKFLRPDFELVTTRSAKIKDSEKQLIRLTQGQFEVLDLLAENDQCLFEGAAGTGKTMLALEYARRSSEKGNKTLLICFNRLLGEWFEGEVKAEASNQVSAGSLYKLLRSVILQSSIADEFKAMESRGQTDELYKEFYPFYGKLALEEKAIKFDVLVLDEAQDLLSAEVLDVLDSWLKLGLDGGKWAMFGDFHQQAIFSSLTGAEIKATLIPFNSKFVKGRLTMNCRNSRNIGEETALLSGFISPPYRMGQVLGLPVDYRYYKTKNDQESLLYNTLKGLLDGGTHPSEIIVISPFRLSNSGISGVNGGEHFHLLEVGERSSTRTHRPIIRFATVQAFKGMESSTVVLCDVDGFSLGESPSTLYVAMSRARAQLTVFVDERARPIIAERIRQKITEKWSNGI